jgi:hypothetical protein
MKKTVLILVLCAWWVLLSGSAQAQFTFTTEAEVQNLLEEITDPLTLTISGGPLSSANTLGGLPHFRLGGGAQVLGLHFHQPGNPANDTQSIYLPSLAFQGRLGIFPGIRATHAVGGILAVDGIYRLGYFPIQQLDNPKFYSIGARVGLLRDRGFVPALSGNVIYSNFLKTLAFSNVVELYGVQVPIYQVLEYKMSIVSYRVDLSKRLLLFTPYVGLGLDDFQATANYQYRDSTNTLQGNRTWNFKRLLKRSYYGVQFGGAVFATTLELGFAEGGHPHFAAGMSVGF